MFKGLSCVQTEWKRTRIFSLMFAVYSLILFSVYRPQRSCDKVMFLHLSVILFTGRLADPPGQTRPLGRHQPSRQPQAHPLGSHPWADTPVGRHPPLCAVPAGIWSRSERYASYWNAFLFFDFFSLWRSVWMGPYTHIYTQRFMGMRQTCRDSYMAILPVEFSPNLLLSYSVPRYGITPHRGNRFSCASKTGVLPPVNEVAGR